MAIGVARVTTDHHCCGEVIDHLYILKDACNRRYMAFLQRPVAISRLRQHFPGMPSTRKEAWRRTAIFVLSLLAAGIAVFAKSFSRIMAMEAILSAFGGAAILWWESNSGPDEIDGLVHFIEQMEAPDYTTAERAMERVGQVLTLLIWCAAILIIASYAWLTARPHGLDSAWWIVFFVGVLTVVLLLGMRSIKWFCNRYMSNIRSDLASHPDPGSRRDTVRRALRTWGFWLFGLAALLQAYPTWVSFSPLP